MGCLRLNPLRLALILALLSAQNSRSLHLDRDGGYHIVVAIDDSVASAEATQDIKLVKEMLDNFGAILLTATNSELYLKSAQILLPSSWREKLGADTSVSMATFDAADMQISEHTEEPVADNYYPCGKPGVRIRLPPWFLDANRARAQFGSQSKGLLNLWLRYRFGVWEEHGYPDHPITPYFYPPNVGEEGSVPPLWRLTSCNGSELLEESSPANRNSSTTCDMHNFGPLDPSCRFHPDTDVNNVSTSLMNFQWVESVQALCNAETHDKLAPNRQNLYCGFRSVWEVILASQDYRALKKELNGGPRGPIPQTEYEIITPNSKPMLYILLDVSGPDFGWLDEVYDPWVAALKAFVDNLPSDVFVTLAYYPNVLDPSTDLVRKLDWTLLDDAKRERIKGVLDFIHRASLAKYFDFRLPLAEVLSELKHKAGSSLLLVLRTEMIYFGQTVLYPGPGPCEEDFVLELRQSGVSLFAVEANIRRDSDHSTNMTLEYLASRSGGMYGEITNSSEPESDKEMARMWEVLVAVVDRLSTKGDIDEPREVSVQIIYKEMLTNVSQTTVWIPEPSACDMEIVHIYVTVVGGTGARMNETEISLVLPDSENSPAPSFSFRKEWFPWITEEQETAPVLSETYNTTVNISGFRKGPRLPLWGLNISVRDTVGDWWGLGSMKVGVTVYGVKVSKYKGDHLACYGRPTLKAEISTSADPEGKFACVSRAVNDEPLAIYAKLTFEVPGGNQSGPMPIFLDNEAGQLSAHLLHLKTGTSITAPLRDDGVGADLMARDGLYSGYIYPHLEHRWRLYVTVYDRSEGESTEVAHEVNPVGRIHSVEQDNLEVIVEGRTLTTPYSAVFEAKSLVRVTSACVRKRFLSRVVDTQVLLDGEDAVFVKVNFTAPLVTASQDEDFEDETEFSGHFVVLAYLAEDVDSLISEDLTNETVKVQGFLIPANSSGKPIEEEVTLKRGNATAYAMVLLDPGQITGKSPLSNIVQIKGWHQHPPKTMVVGCLIGCVLLIEISGGLVIFLLLLTLFLLWKKNRSQANKLRMLSTEEVKEFLHGQKPPPGRQTPDPASGVQGEFLDMSERIQFLPYDSKWEIENKKLHIDRTELLGSGTFGNVYKGYVVNHGAAGREGKVLIVAVKTMKPDMDKSYFKVMLAEVKLMTHMEGEHPNIIRLVGACTKNIRKCQVFLATEFCSNGNLKSHLLKLNEATVSTRSLIRWAREIANGLEFLGRNKIIHGDLATRNILLDGDLLAKVSDFGLSKQTRDYAKYCTEGQGEADEVEAGGGLLPWKWVAPEVLKFGKFSVGSDVWSYGVTLWEIFSFGQVPYPGIAWSPDFVHKLEFKGLRLLKPNFATDAVYDIMASCWALSPKERPGFNKLKAGFDQMMINTANADGEYLDLQVAAESFHQQKRLSYANL